MRPAPGSNPKWHLASGQDQIGTGIAVLYRCHSPDTIADRRGFLETETGVFVYGRVGMAVFSEIEGQLRRASCYCESDEDRESGEPDVANRAGAVPAVQEGAGAAGYDGQGASRRGESVLQKAS